MRFFVFALFLMAGAAEVWGDLEHEVQELRAVVRDQGLVIARLNEYLEMTNRLSATVKGQEGIIQELSTMVQEKCSNNEDEETDVTLDPAGYATIDERVTLLELQMLDVQEDITELDEDVTGLDGDVNFLFDEQVIQDERLFSLEEENDATVTKLNQVEDEIDGLQDTTLALDFRVTILEENGGGGGGNSSVTELEERVETLEGTAADHDSEIAGLESITSDHEARLMSTEEDIQGLVTTDITFDARITALEENSGSQNDTIAFHAALTEYDTIPYDTSVKFNDVFLNKGLGYSRLTGTFTVPSGGDGLYYFSTELLVSAGEYGWFYISLNGDRVCDTYGDNDYGEGDYQHAACSAVLDLVEGDEVEVIYDAGSDGTPLYRSTIYEWNVFSGFRI